MSYMQTFSGKKFHFANPVEAEISIEDIAHSLARICRFNGHCKSHYSVAQHSVYVSQMVPDRHALAGLLHDAVESYTGDMVSPLKKMVPDFASYEDRAWRIIARKFGIPEEIPNDVRIADLRILAMEARDLMDADPVSWGLALPEGDIRIVPWPAELAERHFMDRFHILTSEYWRNMLATGVVAGVA